MTTRTGIGKAARRFLSPESTKLCIIGGVIFDDVSGFNANSDGDVVFHSLCDAITSLTHVPILGGIAKDLCLKDGITDSEVYLQEAVKALAKQRIVHAAIAIEGKKPLISDKIFMMRENLARILNVTISQIGITATSGEGLTDVGLGEGVQAISIVTTSE